MIADEIHFAAEMVAGHEEVYTPEFVVHGIYFGEGDPDHGGQHWNFTRTLGEDDEGVCTGREPQQVTVYGGISRFLLTRTRVTCEFAEQVAYVTGVRRLLIDLRIDDEVWRSLVQQARLVFDGEPYFDLV